MARAIQLGDDPVIEELPEAEEVEVIEEEVAAVSADIDPYDDELVSAVEYSGGVYLTSAIGAPIFSPFYGNHGRKEKEPEKTYLQLPKGKRVITLD